MTALKTERIETLDEDEILVEVIESFIDKQKLVSICANDATLDRVQVGRLIKALSRVQQELDY